MITMLAKDAGGSVIASAVSDPVPAVNTFVPVSLGVSSPLIRSLKWWPSNPNSAVEIDNLTFNSPEPGGVATLVLLCVGALAGAAMLRSVVYA